MDINNIINDNKSGASLLLKKLLKYILSISKKIKDSDLILSNTLQILSKFKENQPCMATFFNVYDEIIKLKKPVNKEILIEKLKSFLLNQERELNIIKEKSKEIIKPDIKILTYSYSSSVENLLIGANEDNIPYSIWILESRPAKEGFILAKKISSKTNEIIISIDMAFFNALNNSDIIITGCDWISGEYFYNKIGTYPLFYYANILKKPTFVIFTSDKIRHNEPPVNFNIKKPDYEIWKNPPKNIKIWNYYFEKIPLKFVSYKIST